MHAPTRRVVLFQFSKANKVFEIKKKQMHFQNSARNARKKSDKFGRKYRKTHVHRVISKIVFAQPQLDKIYKNPKYVLYTYKV